MAMRAPAGFISAFYDPLKNPDAPTIGTATGGDASASVAFTAPTNVGGSAISAYYAVSNPDQITATGASSPVSVTGLTNGTAYTFSVWALNTYGPSAYSASSGSVTPSSPRVVWGGSRAGPSSVISYVVTTTLGNSITFGDLLSATYYMSGCGNASRGLFSGGNAGANVIQYVTTSTTGNATDFGDLIYGGNAGAACANSTRGVITGGGINMQYVTIATTGNATNFGNLSLDRYALAGCSSPTRGLFGGGESQTSRIDYITFATTGNATNFGGLTVARSQLAACSSSTRGVFAGGASGPTTVNVIDYVTIASTGNATDFGDLTVARYGLAGSSSETRGIFGGGDSSARPIDYITIASTGNAVSFGNQSSVATNNRDQAAFSNCHGGLA